MEPGELSVAWCLCYPGADFFLVCVFCCPCIFFCFIALNFVSTGFLCQSFWSCVCHRHQQILHAITCSITFKLYTLGLDDSSFSNIFKTQPVLMWQTLDVHGCCPAFLDRNLCISLETFICSWFLPQVIFKYLKSFVEIMPHYIVY